MPFDGKQVNTEAPQKEINDKSLSDQDHESLIKKFHNNHSYTNGNLYACVCCGFRQLKQLEPKIEYTCIKITDDIPPLKMLHYNEN